MYNPSDIYVSGGADALMVCWTDRTTKFDASSIYVWEHDNLPILDLEERTHLLWEKFGHPTSALTGMSFIVSADATSSCSPLYFTTLSSCINALPEVINCPILVEVASFGDLGSLHIPSKSFGPYGSLEIINRQAAYGPGYVADGKGLTANLDHSNTSYGYLASSFVSNGQTRQITKSQLGAAASGTLAPHNIVGHLSAKTYSNDVFIGSSTHTVHDSRWYDTPLTVFTRRIGSIQNRMTAALKTTGTVGGSPIPWDIAEGYAEKKINFEPYDIDSSIRNSEKMNIYDVSTVNQITGNEVVWGDAAVALETGSISTDRVPTCYSYFNTLDSIKITDCAGPIYIRGFTTDGGASHTLDNGIEIINSNVVLERCSASRFGKAGLLALNSNVKIHRGFNAFRIYSFDANGDRVGTPYLDKRTLQDYSQASYGAGIRAKNSTIEISDTFARDAIADSSAVYFEPASATYGFYRLAITEPIPPNATSLFCISRSDIGIDLINSNLLGGTSEEQVITDSTNAWLDSFQIFLESNSECGLKATNSTVDFKGRLYLIGNHIGLDAESSKIGLDVLKAEYNQREALKLNNTILTYGKEGYPGYLHPVGGLELTRSYNEDQVTLMSNGSHINATNSSIKPVMVSSMPDTYQGFMVSGNIGTEFGKFGTKLIPSITLNNSHVDLVHASIFRDDTLTGDAEPSYGDAILADNNSEVFLRGSSQYATRIIGSTSLTSQNRKAALVASNNSNIHIQGPTVIARFAVDALADNNSNIYIEPHRTSKGNLLVSAFDLENSANHTMVELHSSRACLVADHGSTLTMEDAGSYHPFWPIGAYGSGISLEDYDYLKASESGEYPGYVSGGYIQFFANGIHADAPYDPAVPTSVRFAANVYNPAGVSKNFSASGYIFPYTVDEFGISGITTGGMCVRALNSSKVEVNNVHFPAGWPNASAAFYDFDGPLGACSRLHIWNIADTSQINAKYITVSGVHPRDSGYYGPSGTWGASSAPTSTPDTSSLSVLDYYGADTYNENKFGQDVSRNFGAFRLYFSVDPVTNFLVDPDTIVSGVPYQIFSQGYNFSGSLSAPGDVSSFYTSILAQDVNGVLQPSAFYYASAMMHSPDTIKAVLDDSASNTFANAKHNSVGKSGLAKVVHIYDAYDGSKFGGDSTTTKTDGNGIGSVNNFDLKKDN